jgi:hypothetical protein
MRIRFSKDYDSFSFHEANRLLRRPKVVALKEAMAKMNLLPNAPIICKLKKDGTKEIFDGQHRFQAARELGIPIAYTLLDDNKEVDCGRVDMSHVAEFNKIPTPWSVDDSVRHFCVVRNNHYLRLKDFMEEFKFPATVSALMLSAKISTDGVSKNGFFHSNSKVLKDGTFQIKDWETGVRLAKEIYDFRPYFRKYNHRNFMLALMYLSIGNVYNHKKMMDKMFKYDGLLKFQPTTSAFVENLEYIYNYKTSQNNRVTFV